MSLLGHGPGGAEIMRRTGWLGNSYHSKARQWQAQRSLISMCRESVASLGHSFSRAYHSLD